jgi:3-phenylpropionate/cinnamic acid dioxygenase small subunit
MNHELQYEITHFLNHEAYLLDHRQYREWLELLTDDIIYRMPLRVTVDNKEGTNLMDNMAFFEETKPALETRVARLYTKSAWAENPAPRQRHFISNIMIRPGSDPNELQVRSYFLFHRSRGSDPNTEQLFGEREDVMRKLSGEWKIASRMIYPDQAVLTVMNLSMLL